jgi:hypothetical protein
VAIASGLRFVGSHELEDAVLFRGVVQRMEDADLIDAAGGVEGVEESRVVRGEFGGFEIPGADGVALVGLRLIAFEEMEAQPASIGAGNALRFAEEGDEEQQHEIGIDPGLKLQVAREVLAREIAFAAAKGQCGVQSMIDFFYKGDEVADVRVAESAARIVVFELFDQPARVVDPDEKIVATVPEKRARQFTQFTSLGSGEGRELAAAIAADEAILQGNPAAGVGALEETGDLGEERAHRRRKGV